MDAKPRWYQALSERKHARQIVIDVPAEAQVPSRVKGAFVGPMLSRAASRNWAAMTLFMDGGEGPFIFVKANGVVEALRGCATDVAFSFYRYPAAGLLQIFVHVRSPALERRGSPYIVENGHWPDSQDSQEIIGGLFASKKLEVCFLADTPNVPLQGYFGLRVALPQDLGAALRLAWADLTQYHASIDSTQRDNQFAMRQFERENPIDENPILPAD